MAASDTQSRRFDATPEDLEEAVDRALDDIRASGVNWNRAATKVRASTEFSFWSYGENLTIELFEDGEVEIRSECMFPLQLFSWGKNGRNCRRFLDAVERNLERRSRKKRDRRDDDDYDD